MAQIPEKLTEMQVDYGIAMTGAEVRINQLIDWAHGVEERLKFDEVLKAAEPTRWQYEPFLSTCRYMDSTKGEYRNYHEVIIKFDTKEQAEAYRNQLLARGTHTPDRPLSFERE